MDIADENSKKQQLIVVVCLGHDKNLQASEFFFITPNNFGLRLHFLYT